jgi:hypothetical protein
MGGKVFFLIFFIFFSYVKGLAQERVYFNQTEIGFIWGKGQKDWEGNYLNRTNLSVSTFHGVYINRHQVVGFSIGYDQYDEIKLLPMALGWRGFIGKEKKPNLFAGLDIGGGTAFLEKRDVTEWYTNWYEGGMMIHPSVGVKLPAKKGNWNLSVSLGYKRQEASFLEGYLDRSGNSNMPENSNLRPGFSSLNETSYLFHSLVFRMGLLF